MLNALAVTKEKAMSYVSFAVDDALAIRSIAEIPSNARLVGWQCGFEPLFVAVWSHLGVSLKGDEAEDIARDLLVERKWFADCENPPPADYVL